VYYDAHQHLHDARLAPVREAILAALPARGIAGGVVNGTRESDWPAVAALCAQHPAMRPSFGLHPWHVAERTDRWEAALHAQLDAHPGAGIGETGLDCWIENHDLADQTRVFVRQLAMARERNAPLTIHCVRAHEPLRQVLQKHAAPARGFLLHAWSGPASLTGFLLERGAHFSFPPYFLHPRKAPQRELFATLPAERVLIETDAPDLAPPPEHNENPLFHPVTGKPLNSPFNLVTAAAALAGLRGVSVAELAELTARNWRRLFESNQETAGYKKAGCPGGQPAADH
jgi:TatD DNase family protein